MATGQSEHGYPGFGGRVGRTFAGSEGWWPERPAPPLEPGPKDADIIWRYDMIN